MKLFRFGSVDSEKPGVILEDGRKIDVSGFWQDFGEKFFASGGVAHLRKWCASHASELPPNVEEGTRLASAVARPSKLVCIGLNYRAHALEIKAAIPEEPVVFFKSTTALAGPNDDVVLPRGSTKTDWEAELAVVIGSTVRNVETATAMSYVAGFCLHNDYSERAFQFDRGGQWVKGKSADTFAPLGPFLATTDEVDPSHLDVWLRVNGETKQKGNTSDMIFDVPFIVSYVSQFMTLLPGDVISTGTPAGVGMGRTPPQFLKAGDVVELGITGLGVARQRIVPAEWR